MSLLAHRSFIPPPVVLLVVAAGGCTDRTVVAPPSQSLQASAANVLAAPSPIVTVTTGGGAFDVWPYTGNDFSGQAADPINLVFVGNADPRALRAALLLLDGDRTAFGLPHSYPFNCTWHDVPEGDAQTAYGPAGWVGSAIQLACGEYGPVRFHVRFFDAGGLTLGGAHFDLQIPGTPQHQVISWEVPEQLVALDFMRTGLLGAAPALTDMINATPSYREIPAVIYNGMPADLRALVGGPQIPSDGRATLLTLAGSVDGQPLVARTQFVVDFDQVLPNPNCPSGPLDYLLVRGPVTFRQQVVFTPSGDYLSHFTLLGHLDLTPVNPLTDPPTPIGDTYRALLSQHHKGVLTDNVTLVSSFSMQLQIPQQGPFRGRLFARLNVGPGGSSFADLSLRCD
jgi:hypothetical protein